MMTVGFRLVWRSDFQQQVAAWHVRSDPFDTDSWASTSSVCPRAYGKPWHHNVCIDICKQYWC